MIYVCLRLCVCVCVCVFVCVFVFVIVLVLVYVRVFTVKVREQRFLFVGTSCHKYLVMSQFRCKHT